MSKNTEKPYQHDDPEAVSEAKAKAKVLQKEAKEEIIALMALPAFRRFIWEILEKTHIFSTSFTGNSETFFKEGERNVGLRIFLRLQENDPEGYALMVKENSKGAK